MRLVQSPMNPCINLVGSVRKPNKTSSHNLFYVNMLLCQIQKQRQKDSLLQYTNKKVTDARQKKTPVILHSCILYSRYLFIEVDAKSRLQKFRQESLSNYSTNKQKKRTHFQSRELDSESQHFIFNFHQFAGVFYSSLTSVSLLGGSNCKQQNGSVGSSLKMSSSCFS